MDLTDEKKLKNYQKKINKIWNKHLQKVSDVELKKYCLKVYENSEKTIKNVWKRMPRKAIALRKQIAVDLNKINDIEGHLIEFLFLGRIQEEGCRRWMIKVE